MYHILQLSDIHLGSDYNGNLDTYGHLSAVLKHAKDSCPEKSGYDAVIITGDLMDDTVCLDQDNNAKSHEVELSSSEKLAIYTQILTEAKKLAKLDGLTMVTPGNHDNRALLGQAATSAGYYGASPDMFMNPGECIQVAKLGNRSIITIDSGTVNPYQAYANLGLLANTHKDSFDAKKCMIFSHKPIKSHNLYHRFMADKMLPQEFMPFAMQYSSEYFCGHLHHVAKITVNEFSMRVCPGIQCQIDPYSEKCNAVDFPGYIQISFDYCSNDTTVKINMLDNWRDLIDRKVADTILK